MRLPTFFSLALFAAMSFAGEGPPTSNGIISNPTLVQNSAIAKAQAIGAITTFMSKGSQECDADGKNCKSMFGNDDSMNVTSAQMSAQSTTGIQAFSFESGSSADERMDANTIASQMGTLVLACGDWQAKNVAGIAIKLNECTVNMSGDAQVKYQVCTAPARGNPVEPPERTVVCSTDPSSPNFRPPVGYSCSRPACSTSEEGSLNGWSAPITVTYQQAVAESGSDDQKSKNGLGLSFYPAIGGGVPGDFSSDSDNMTAVKVVQTAINKDTHQSALGLRVAFRHKTKVTKEMMIQGASSVPNPGQHSAAWDTIEKLQGNALIPQYQATYAKNGSECMQQITEGLATDGVVSVCDQGYTNESGVRPGALTAQMAGEGQNCGTTAQCLNEVVNTNTWTQTCNAEVPLSIRKCTTKQDYDLESLSYTRTRTKEICTEERTNAVYTCRTYGEIEGCSNNSTLNSGGVDMNATNPDTSIVIESQIDPLTMRVRFGTIGDNYWYYGYFSRNFVIDIRDKEELRTFTLTDLAYDDEVAIAVNGNWVWADYPGASYSAERDQWGRMTPYCVKYDNTSDGGGGCLEWEDYWVTQWERNTSWSRTLNLDLRSLLKEGRNVIRVDTGTVGGGESWLYFNVSAWKTNCTTRVVNECSSYESAR